MLPKISLLEEIKKGGYEASLITTFNAYLPFYEEVVLRRLVSAGARHNVLLMDGQQYAMSVASHPPRLAGRSYTLMPVHVPGAFHPKLIFLTGKRKGLVVVGSHNMTIAGFGFNRELTNVIRISPEDDEAVSIAHKAWSAVEHWLDRFSAEVPTQILDMVHRVKDFSPWLKNVTPASEASTLLAGSPEDEPLWTQLSKHIKGDVAEVSIHGAFFDQKLEFLHRVQEDLAPEVLRVAIDPETVQMPISGRDLSNVSMVSARGLGLEEDEDTTTNRYLHAKGLLIEQSDGNALLCTGSANPSRPAWLASKSSGNVELMLIHKGYEAGEIAEQLGIMELRDCPPITDDEWDQVERNQSSERPTEEPSYGVGVAVMLEDQIQFESTLLKGMSISQFSLVRDDGEQLAMTTDFQMAGSMTVVKFAQRDLAHGAWLDCLEDSELVAKLLLHHSREVEEQARTGVQRRFREALQSLETESPDISLLIDCIDKIVFTRDSNLVRTRSPNQRGSSSAIQDEGHDLGSLAIDVEEMNRKKGKSRLSYSSDFAYLLDTLIYHLRFRSDKSIEEIDSFGRNEEEQIGSDDEEDSQESVDKLEAQKEVIEVCHSKVRTIVNRSIKQIDAYKQGEQPLEQLLVRLLGVLAVLRELRNCDSRVRWVEKGNTTVPRDQRVRLLEEVMFNLFEGKASLLHLDSLDANIQTSEDIARLKGLIVWLAWDCGLTLDLHKPFMESPSQMAERLQRNAMILALAQLIVDDDVANDEARQSIGNLSSSELDWFKDLQALSSFCELARFGGTELIPAAEAEIGDIAIHDTLETWDLRFVAGCSSDRISLVKLSKDKSRSEFQIDHLHVSRLQVVPR